MALDPISLGVGTGLAVAGLLLAFDGAINGYLRIEGFFATDNGSRDLALSYHIEKHKLKTWGDHFNVNEPENCLLKDESEDTKNLIGDILARILVLHDQAKPFLSRYDPGKSSIPIGDQDQRLQPGSMLVQAMSKLSMDKRQRNRVRWVIKDRQAFTDVVANLEKLNAALYGVLRPRENDSLIKTLSSYVLAAISDKESLKDLQKADSGSSALLALSARLKELQMSDDAATSVTRIEKPSRVRLGKSAERTMGTYQQPGSLDQRVWVEWRYVSPIDRIILINRIESLGAMLSAVNLTDLKIPRFLGIFEDEQFALRPEAMSQTRTGFTYAVPLEQYDALAKPITLLQIITDNKEPPALGERFRLAFSLASSLVLLHASRWLHKAFRTDNVIFFHGKTNPKPAYPSVTTPYITGFEYSRPDQAESIGLRPTGSNSLDYFYHPDIKNGFTKILDLYSLGVVLMEIAWWRPLHTKIPAEKLKTLPSTREVLIQSVNQLGSMMGTVYRDVVRTCLECDLPDDDDEDLAHAVFHKIVRQLDYCRA